MKLGLVINVLGYLPFADAISAAAEIGYETIELELFPGSPFGDVDDFTVPARIRELSRQVGSLGLSISALGNHRDGQLVLGPHHSDTDSFHGGSPTDKVRFGTERMIRTAQLASELCVPVVTGFCGCEDYTRFFPWPDPDAWVRMEEPFVERWSAILEKFQQYGVKFAHEPHPKQFVYNLETALRSVSLLSSFPSWGFNYDPANLLLAGMDPVVFISELGCKIFNVHAKDGEMVPHNLGRSGLFANGAWNRPDRGFRFRLPGWGSLNWNRVVSELALAQYDGVISVEHEDPILPRKVGAEKAFAFLRPLVFDVDPPGHFWGP